jgi:hypothetical protein
VQVKIISIEEETKRIGLSMKALMPKAVRERKRTPRHRPRATPTREPAPVPEGGADTAPRRRQIRRPPRRRKPEEPAPEDLSAVAPAAENSGEPEPPAAGPKPSMQEKIALLQSKFRGSR